MLLEGIQLAGNIKADARQRLSTLTVIYLFIDSRHMCRRGPSEHWPVHMQEAPFVKLLSESADASQYFHAARRNELVGFVLQSVTTPLCSDNFRAWCA
eukprot:2997715-Pleurochrysis_carterae.AAC.4